MSNSKKKSLQNKINIWANQVRAPFLLLPIVLTAIGGAVAHKEGLFNGMTWILTTIGVTLAHVSVNLFNEHSDNQTGIDRLTNRTPFSGGSGNLQQGLTSLNQVLFLAIATLLIASAIGLYLAVLSSWMVVPIMVIGILSTVLYTSHLSRWMLGEIAAGISLGSLVVIGAYLVQTQTVNTTIVLISIPPGILTALLLLLNEFPDARADRQGGRRHLVITLGWKKSAVLYSVAMVINYAILVLGVIFNLFPPLLLISLLTVPLALVAAKKAYKSRNRPKDRIPGLAANVGAVLGTNALITIAYLV